MEETGTALQVHNAEDPSESQDVASPTRAALGLLALSHGIPFVGFGFLDNFIMVRKVPRRNYAGMNSLERHTPNQGVCWQITAGESIEAGLGATFTVSSMCAAGYGNLVRFLLARCAPLPPLPTPAPLPQHPTCFGLRPWAPAVCAT